MRVVDTPACLIDDGDDRKPSSRQRCRGRVRRDTSIGFGVLLPACLASMVAARAAEIPPSPSSQSFPMTAGTWQRPPQPRWVPGHPTARATFARYEGMASGVMTIVDEAVWASRMATFAEGTIEFDIKPLAYGDTGIVFHRRNNDRGEFLYLRANPDCPAASDCIQYAPITHGLMPWNNYSAEQEPAPINATGWNHVRIVVKGGGMAVFLNRLSEPSIVVPALLSGAPDGGIAFKGPAAYANLVIRPGVGDDFRPPSEPAPDTVMAWSAAPPSALPNGRAPFAGDIPAENAWKPVMAEASGLLDLDRLFGTAWAPKISTAWLRFTIHADAPGRRVLDCGFAEQVTVFLNGRPIYVGDNPYFPSDRRLSPDGRLEPDNASVTLDLRRGDNRIVLAVGNRWHMSNGGEESSPYGWGAEARLHDAVDSDLPRQSGR